MLYKPFAYQTFAKNFIIEHKEAGLFLDMGMGKTVSTLTAIEELKYDLFEVNRALVVAPKKVALEVWGPEQKKWDHLSRLRVTTLLGTAQERRQALQEDADVYVINRENVVWLVNELKGSWNFDMVVLDELSSFKAASSQRFRALKKIRKRVSRVVGLTGTPTSTGLLDLWPEMYLLDLGKSLGPTLTGYRDRYFVPDQRNASTIFSWKLRPGADAEIHERIAPVCVSMKIGDYVKLPGQVVTTHTFELSESIMSQYRRLERDCMLQHGGGEINAVNAGVLVNKLLQLSSGAVYDDSGEVHLFHDEKFEVLDSLIEQANGQSVVVYYTYKHELERLRAKYPKARHVLEPGAVQDWNDGKIEMLLAHPASAGHGLNLQYGGHIIIWLGWTCSLELYEQANARLRRLNQKYPVLVHRILAAGTFDARAACLLDERSRSLEDLLQAIKAQEELYGN
ncbi:MAG: DEAD/DEAH box helicase [Eubacteriales bacterium]|nr:DEAD/DEAH box helicase [Eubacteriales bacterium]